MSEIYEQDRQALKQIVEKLFVDLSWEEGRAPDWSAFKGAFRDDAALYPSARPATQTSLSAFVDRMDGLRREGALKSLVETPLAFDVTVFGTTALAYMSYSAVINGAASKGANGFMFVKDEGHWKIGALAWDNEGPDAPFCSRLTGVKAEGGAD